MTSATYDGRLTRLALIGIDGSDAARMVRRPGTPLVTSDPEASLRDRGYDCAALTTGAESLDAAVQAFTDRHGAPPQRVIAFAAGAATRDAFALMASRPHALHGVVCIDLAPGLEAYDVSGFANAGGRAILIHGERDSDVPAREAIAVLESFESTFGGAVRAAGAMRLFVVPDAGRSAAGYFDGRLDLAEPIERWLDWTPRRPPDVLVLHDARDGASASTRPLYPYPLRSVYKGRGDRAHWKSWYAPAVYRRTPEPLAREELSLPLPQDPARRASVAVRAGVGPVLVVGATGRLGVELVRTLHAHRVAVRAAVRNAAKATELLPPGVETALVDVRDPHAVARAMRGVRNVVFAASATAGGDGANTPAAVEYEGALTCIAAAKSERVAHFVLISSAASTQPLHVHNLWGEILTWKQRSEIALRASGVPYTVLRPLGLRPAPGHVPYPARSRGIRFTQGDRIAFGEEIHREDVAALCVALLEHPAAMGASFEAYNDDSLPPDSWPDALDALARD